MTRPWWEPRAALRRFVADLLADELARHRRAALPHAQLWGDALRLDADLGVDSLELMTVATALAEALHLHASGIEDYLLARRTLGEWVDIAHTGLERFSDVLTFRTSGSTGTPKPCLHPLDALRQETRHLATLFPGRRRILAAVPAHHIYGFLFTMLLPRELGMPEEAVQDMRGSTPAWLARGALPGDLVVGHPEFWRAVARTVPALPPDVLGVTSTAPCPDEVAQHLQRAGLCRLVQVYGASETAGIGARQSHEHAYELFPHWRFDEANPHWLLRTLPDGGEQAAVLPDALIPAGGRRFRVGARHDEAVQVGGINVFPARVREVLRRHPAVQDAAVRLMRPEEGTRLKAFIVARGSQRREQDLVAELQQWVERELTTPERPKAIRFGAALPLTPSGKLADWNLLD
ncbi:MAG TPA: AMP-binding protein [Ramlibacter sp.]